MKIVHIQQYFNEGFGYQENVLPYYQKKLGHDVIMITSLSYDNIALESIQYRQTLDPKDLHKKFMAKKYSDIDYKFFRRIDRTLV